MNECSITKCKRPKHQRSAGTTDKPAMCRLHDAIYEDLRKMPAGRLARAILNADSVLEATINGLDE